MSVERPLAAQDVLEQPLAAAARFVVGAVVRAHHGFHLRLGHRRAESGQIGFTKVFFGHHGIEGVTFALRTAVNGKVLGARRRLEVFRIVPLHALDEPDAQPRGEVRILPVGFVSAAPAGIPEDVDIGRPEGEPLVDAEIAFAGGFMVLGAAFGGDDIRHLFQKTFVKGSGQTNGLREHGGHTGTRHAVQRLVPPVVEWDAQTRNGRRGIKHLANLFLQGHA